MTENDNDIHRDPEVTAQKLTRNARKHSIRISKNASDGKISRPKSFRNFNVKDSEERIKEIVCKLIEQGHDTLEHDELDFQIIKLIKCDMQSCEEIVKKMSELGLHVCGEAHEPSLVKFAEMRGYISSDIMRKKV